MQDFEILKDIRVFGMPVKTFPNGVAEAFEAILSTLPGGFDRSFFGIARMTDDKMEYIAAAEEKFPGEANEYSYETFVIEKGKYAAETLYDWRENTQCIKDIFQRIMTTREDCDDMKPCVEWYKSDHEMQCLVKLKA